ncbi:MAG: glutathione synthase [Myxococcota bacterium]
MRVVFVMDPVSSIVLEEDTSFALMLAAQERGHRVDHCLVTDVWLDGSRVAARVRPATMRRDPSLPVRLGEAEDVELSDVDVVMIRKDPPFDVQYLWLTLVLEHLRGTTLVVNDPRGLRECNEHLYANYFPEVIPETAVTADKARIKEFMTRVGGRAILKPVDGFAGDKIFLLSKGDPNLNSVIETITKGGSSMVIVQEYLPQVRQGDKRVLLLDGEPLGAILRIAPEEEVRSNIHVGGTVAAGELDDADHRIVEAVAPRLRQDGLWFVGLDVIGGKLTELNVTSPTGIQQMSRLMGEDLSGRAIAWLERRVESGATP